MAETFSIIHEFKESFPLDGQLLPAGRYHFTCVEIQAHIGFHTPQFDCETSLPDGRTMRVDIRKVQRAIAEDKQKSGR